MKRLREAVVAGRLIELAGLGKEAALEALARATAAACGLAADEVCELVAERERQAVTALGHGWACPHARTSRANALVATLGWSHDGLDYGAADGVAIHLVALFVIPEGAGREYLMELGELARAVQSGDDLGYPWRLSSVDEVRQAILRPGSARQSGQTVPFHAVLRPGFPPIVLSTDPAVVAALEGAPGLPAALTAGGNAMAGGYRIEAETVQVFAGERRMVNGLARQGNA